MDEVKEYYAFISYKREDEKWAKWLQHKLEHYKLPSNLNGRTDLPKEIRPIFKDNSELSPGNLPLQIHAALEQSKNLIVICSPRSAQSGWVNKEIEAFISMGKTANVIPFVVEGTPYAKNAEEECFPTALRQLPDEQEILGANINEMGRDAAAVKVVARMFDVKFDSLWQRYEREQKKKRLIQTSIVTAFVLGILGVAAWIWHQNVLLKEKDWKMMENQARAVAEKAIQLTNEENNSYLARLLALDVLPTNVDQPDRPYTSEAEAALRWSCQYNSAILRGHTYDVNSALFSPNGKYIVSASSDSTIRIWNTETGQCIHVLKGHNGYVKHASYSPDGQCIVSASWDNDIRIWDAQSGQCLQTLKAHTGSVETASFSPDGKRIVSASRDSTIRIWDATTGECLQTLTGHTGGVVSAFYSPDGKSIVSASGLGDLSVRIWDAETGKNTKILKGHKLFVHRAIFSPDGKRIVSVSLWSTARIWDVETGKCLHILEGEDNGIREVVFSPDGKYIVLASSEGRILLWDVESGQMLGSIGGVVRGVNSISFSPDGQYLLLASDDKTIRIWSWDLSKNEKVLVMRTPDGNTSAFYSPDGRKIVSSSFDENVHIWDAETGKCLQTLEGHFGEVNFVSFNSDGKHILSASEDGTARVWDIEKGKFIQAFSWNESSSIFSAFYSPNGKYIVAASQESETICLWDAETGAKIPSIDEHGLFASFSSDSKSLVIASGHNLLICDLKTGQCVQTMHGHTKSINTVYFSPNGKQVVSASYDNTIRIWDIETGECIHILEGHYDVVNSAIFSSDGKLIVSASSDKTIRIWDVETGQCLHILVGHSDEAKTASFCPDGRHIVSASLDGTIRIWDFPPLQELIDQTRERFRNRPLTPEERRKYYLE